MAKTFAVGDLVRVANPSVDADADQDFIGTIVRDKGTEDYTYNFILDPEPQTYNQFRAEELKRLGKKERRAYEAGRRDANR